MAKGDNRLISLDIFRGLTVAFMIIVNNPGSWDYVYAPLRHAKWNGCTPTDLVFPFFIFISGVSAFLSLKKYGNEFNWRSLLRIVRRTLSIFLLGLVLAAIPFVGVDYSSLRIMGVLQRIALVYGIGSFICLAVRKEYLWIVLAFILLLYWALLAFFGGHDPYSLQGNFVLTVDKAILGANHLYKEYGIPFDPEGLLSTLPAIGTFLIGYFIGDTVSGKSADAKTGLKIILLGISCFGLGYGWNYLLPVNKSLWTSSYVLYTAGLAMGVFSVIYLVADVLKFPAPGRFFEVFGRNALFSYFIAGVLAVLTDIIHIGKGTTALTLNQWLFKKVYVPVAGNLTGSLISAIMLMLLVWALAFLLYRKKVIIRL